MPPLPSQLEPLTQWFEPLVTFCSLLGMWLLYRTNRWLAEHLERERTRYDAHKRKRKELATKQREREIARQNELLRVISEAYAHGEPHTLDDLLSHAERDFTLRSSRTPSGYPERRSKPPSYRRTIPPSPPPRSERDEDWEDLSDSHLETEERRPPTRRR